MIPETTQVYAATLTDDQVKALQQMVCWYAISWVGTTKYVLPNHTRTLNLFGYTDCSGFVYCVFKAFGASVPSSTGDWLGSSRGLLHPNEPKLKPKDYKNELQPGDVIVTKSGSR